MARRIERNGTVPLLPPPCSSQASRSASRRSARCTSRSSRKRICHAFVAAIGVQLGIVVLLILATRALPAFTPSSSEQVVAADA